LNHQDSTSQPMNYYNVTANATTGRFATVSAAHPTTATPVTGIVYDTRSRRACTGALCSAPTAVPSTTRLQDTVKLKAGYAFTPELLAAAPWPGYWTNDTTNTNRTHLRDEQGQPVWSGKVTDGR
jgi:iron complex outermembrane receptor protein